MNIETKYANGDVVFAIGNYPVKKWQSCGFCPGTGKIVGNDGNERFCPECYGRMGKYIYEPQQWQVNHMILTIGQVRITITDSPGQEGETVFDNFKEQHGREESYMCIETGIGSGSVHRADTLYPSIEAAQTECDRRNAEEVVNEPR